MFVFKALKLTLHIKYILHICMYHTQRWKIYTWMRAIAACISRLSVTVSISLVPPTECKCCAYCIHCAYWDFPYNRGIFHICRVFENHFNVRYATPVSFDQNCLHLIFYDTLEVNHSPVNRRNCQIYLSMHAKILKEKTTLLKTCAPQIWLCLFMFRPITLFTVTNANS